MRWTQTYIPTLREIPSDAELISHQFMLRGGFIRKLAAGVYIYLPLMQRVIEKFSKIVREEMNKAGAIEITMPVLHPAEVWLDSGRYNTVGKEQMRLKDRHEHEMVLGGTHEEVVTTLLRGELKSYRQLPINLYQIQVKFRDEIRPRFGLMRGREFIMKDAYTFDTDEESFMVAYQKMVDAYFAIFKRAGLDTKKVESDTGAMGGKAAHEFMLIVDTDGGEETILFCDKCEYAANVEKAAFREANPVKPDKDMLKTEEVDTPNSSTIEEVTAFLKVDAKRLVKTLIYLADDKPVAALIRGDRELNLIKLKNQLGAVELEIAPAAVVENVTKCPVGYAGPLGLMKEVPIIVDNEVTRLKNFIVGANKKETHILNVNLGRDFKATATADIINAVEGELCPLCEGHLTARKGIEVGNTFMLGTKYSESMGARFSDADGNEKPFIMGSYGIGITRTPQAAVERYHDEKGIIWPKNIAPYLVEIIPLNYEKEDHKEAAEQIYAELVNSNIDCLLDDRPERAGVKFNDADLVGIPLRIIIGDRALKQGKVELKSRGSDEVIMADLKDVLSAVREYLERIN
ncbi:MAG: proline--tRNA ligase [candidate division Zixibacteria bacterium HGW-Zixibacteria-1]|nr:MAG: proline--tRNA ligase [candidate division Zixibacteria bacterium HGW-Zixibacteria-1]